MYPESPRPHTPDPVPVSPLPAASEAASSQPYHTPLSVSGRLSGPSTFSGSSHVSALSSFYGATTHRHLPTAPLQWSTGLCHCCDDPANVLITCVFPCITFGQIAHITNRGWPSCLVCGIVYALCLCLTASPCLFSCCIRSKLRHEYNLEEVPCNDCFVHCCCEPCALCQEYRELQGRGFDMGIGWQANFERQNRGITSPPGMVGGMIR